MIEHLPQETVDRLTDMRELDLQVQSKKCSQLSMFSARIAETFKKFFSDSLDNIEKRTTRFFQNAYNLTQNELDAENNNMLKEYKKILEDSGMTYSPLYV